MEGKDGTHPTLAPFLKKNLFELKLIVYIVMSDHKLINIQVFFFCGVNCKK